jgi:NADH-quinone oxidoreductase subunit A
MFFDQFGPLLLLLMVSVIFPSTAIIASWLFSRFRIRVDTPNAIKNAPYECGVDPIGPAWARFNFRYYFYALVFVIFDIETVFLYPWAVQLRHLALFGLAEMVVFIGILAVGFAYAWRKQALEWQ